MNSSSTPSSSEADILSAEAPATFQQGTHPDPITGEPGAHPAAVGVGALGAGATGAAIGAFAGPIGVVVGAAIGALAGGLAGHEIASTPEDSAAASKVANASDTEFATEPVGSAEPALSETDINPFPDPITGALPGLESGSEESVRLAAYHRYLDRQQSARSGDEVSDWHEAEREAKGA